MKRFDGKQYRFVGHERGDGRCESLATVTGKSSLSGLAESQKGD